MGSPGKIDFDAVPVPTAYASPSVPVQQTDLGSDEEVVTVGSPTVSLRWRASDDRKRIQVLPSIFRNEPPQRKLHVNPGDRHYRIVGKSREKGEKELRGLVEKGNLEEHWVFVEALDRQGHLTPLWYEDGDEQTAAHVAHDLDFLTTILDDIRKLELRPIRATQYHIHPLTPDLKTKDRAEVEWINFFSEGDYLTFANSYFGGKGRAFEDWHLLESDSRIITPIGIWKLTPVLPPPDDTLGWEEQARQGFMVLWNIRQEAVSYSFFVRQCGMPQGLLGNIPLLSIFATRKMCSPAEIIAQFSRSHIKIDFTPF